MLEVSANIKVSANHKPLISRDYKTRLGLAAGKPKAPGEGGKDGFIMAQKLPKNKRKTPGIRIKSKEGLWIKYQLRLRGITLSEFAAAQGVKPCTVSGVFSGLRCSERLLKAAVKSLGYPSFEDLLAAARGKGGPA